MKNLEKELIELINEYVDKACSDNLPRICKLKSTETGRENLIGMILQQCKATGSSVQYAMAVIDSELTND